MRIHELPREQCLDVLTRSTLGHLACSRDDEPYVVPIHFSFDADRYCLYSFSPVGQKIEWMRENPKVCVAIDDIADKYHWTTLIVFGRYQEIHDSPSESAMRHRVLELFRQRHEWWFPAAGKLGSRESHAVVIYGIQIERITGRTASRDRAASDQE